MIIVHINPAGVEKVFFQSPNDLFEDLCLAAWPLVRHELARLDRKLKKAAKKALSEIEREDEPRRAVELLEADREK